MIRVTSGAYADRLISNLGTITARQARYQAQVRKSGCPRTIRVLCGEP